MLPQRKKIQGLKFYWVFLCVPVSVWVYSEYSNLLPQSYHMYVGSTGVSKLIVGVSMSAKWSMMNWQPIDTASLVLPTKNLSAQKVVFSVFSLYRNNFVLFFYFVLDSVVHYINCYILSFTSDSMRSSNPIIVQLND